MKMALLGLVVRVVLVGLQATVRILPDTALAKVFRALERLVFAITADRNASVPIGDIADIFESGRPHTDRVRKFLTNIETEVLISAVKCLASPSPYGAG